VETLGAVLEHRWHRLARVQPASIDFANVGHEVGLGSAGVADELGQTT
jgi:hypothetical protein